MGTFTPTFLCTQYTTNILKKSDYFNYDTLRILEFLYCHNGTKFTYLQKRLDMSSGSLINRLRKLKDAEYIFQKLYTYESGKHEVRYTLTIAGHRFVELIDVVNLIKKIDTAYAKISKGCS